MTRSLILLVFLIILIEIEGVSEYDSWRGKSSLDDLDMVEIGLWVSSFNATALKDAFKFYWNMNEVYFAYCALIRSMFGMFDIMSKDEKLSTSFLLGTEAMIHYMILKSFPVIARLGGIRGNGYDEYYLRESIKTLVKCYERKTKDVDFYEDDVFPLLQDTLHNITGTGGTSARKKRKILSLFPHAKNRGNWRMRVGRQVDEGDFETGGDLDDSFPESVDDGEAAVGPDDFLPDFGDDFGGGDEGAHEMKKRYSFTLNQASSNKGQKTTITMRDPQDNRMENIAANVFWHIYQILPHICSMPTADIQSFNGAFDYILGLVISMYKFDSGDYAAEYEKIFQMPIKDAEKEWERYENILKKISSQKKIPLLVSYSDEV